MLKIHLLHPLILLEALPVIAFMAYLLYRGYKLRAKARQAYGDERLLSKFSKAVTFRREAPVMVAWIVVAFLIAIIVAMPVSSGSPSSVPVGSTKLVAVIDVSPSMAAEDHRDKFPAVHGKPPMEVLGPYGRRIDEVQLAIEEQIMPAIAGNEMGIVLYEGDGKDQVDLDDDFQKIHWEFANDWIEIGQAPGDGSDYGKGLASALNVFAASKTPGTQKVIVLFSDGGNDNLDRKALAQTVEKIKAQGIKVLIVAVGGDKPMKLNTYNAQGVANGYVHLDACDDKDGEGNCQTRLNFRELQELAAIFNTQPLRLEVGSKLPIQWATAIGGSKAVNEPSHLYRFLLVPCLLLVLLIQLRNVFFRHEGGEK